MDVEEKIKEIAKLSVDFTNTFKDTYDKDLVQSAAILIKYLLIGKVQKDKRHLIDNVSNEEYCALCHMFIRDNCNNCTLKDGDNKGCGHERDGLIHAVKNGTFMDIAHNVSYIISEPIKRYLKGD